jgi:hypothetical protein
LKFLLERLELSIKDLEALQSSDSLLNSFTALSVLLFKQLHHYFTEL